jgi:hypothetical protein
MRFKDPIASVKFMGGSPPIHFLMAIYGCIAYFHYNFKNYCPEVNLVS